MLGEACCNPETGSIRGKLPYAGTEQPENSPRDTPPANTSPVAQENLMLSTRGCVTLTHCKLLGLEHTGHVGVFVLLVLLLTCLLPGAGSEKVLGCMGLPGPVLCFQTDLVLINSFKHLCGKIRN